MVRHIKCWYLIIIYNKYEVENTLTNFMRGDIGLDNLGTITAKVGLNQYIFCGKEVKVVNYYANKSISYLQAIEMKKVGSDKFKNTKEIDKV